MVTTTGAVLHPEVSENSLTGRVIKIKPFKNAHFFTLNTYSEVQKIFKPMSCVIERNTDSAAYQKLTDNIFLGAVIKISYKSKLDHKNEPLLAVQSIVNYNHFKKEIYSPFPKSFKLDALTDKEKIYKNRGLAFSLKTDLLNHLAKKYVLLEKFRETLIKEGFLFVNVPVLESYSGGAEAKLFETKCLYNKKTYYLRTCLEFPLKGLLVAGFPKVFHIGSAFRNETLDTTHAPEFLFCEAYAIDKDLTYFKQLTERLYAAAYYEVNKSYFKHDFDVSKPWPTYEREFLQQLMKEKNFENLDALIDSKTLGPFFHIKGYECVLAKTASARIESYCDYNVELCNYYEEENSCFDLSQKSKLAEVPVAPQFLEVLSHGMPVATGWGIGLDRLVLSCLNISGIRNVQEYPLY